VETDTQDSFCDINLFASRTELTSVNRNS